MTPDGPALDARASQRSIDGIVSGSVRRAPIRQQRQVTARRQAPAVITISPEASLTPALSPSASSSLPIVAAQPFAQPAAPKQQPTRVLQRQFVRPVQPPVQYFEPVAPVRQKRHGRAQVAVLVMAGIVFFAGIFVAALTLQTNHSAKNQVSALSTHNNTVDAPPSETKPSAAAVQSYSVAPSLPKYLKIPKLNLDSRIAAVGVTKTNDIGAPDNIYDAAWYNESATPGASANQGAMLIDGHVHGPTLPGVFANLEQLAVGDTIQVVRGDNTTFNYVVKKVQNYSVSQLSSTMLLSSYDASQPGLNLITCGGPYDKVSGQYTQRTVVFATEQ